MFGCILMVIKSVIISGISVINSSCQFHISLPTPNEKILSLLQSKTCKIEDKLLFLCTLFPKIPAVSCVLFSLSLKYSRAKRIKSTKEILTRGGDKMPRDPLHYRRILLLTQVRQKNNHIKQDEKVPAPRSLVLSLQSTLSKILQQVEPIFWTEVAEIIRQGKSHSKTWRSVQTIARNVKSKFTILQ